MAETMITCPKCQHPFALTEAMAAPIEAALRAKYEGEARKQAADQATRESALLQKQAELDNARASLASEVAAQVAAQRSKLAAEAKVLARQELSGELKAVQDEVNEQRAKLAAAQGREADLQKRERTLEDGKRNAEAEMRRVLEAERAKITADARREAAETGAAEMLTLKADLEVKAAQLKAAQAQELALRQERAKLADEKESLSLRVQRELDAGRDQIKADARKQSDDENRLKLAESEQKIAAITRQLQEAQRRAEQGSQQAQGEVFEIELEAILRAHFRHDLIEPVPKGIHGGDVFQRVRNEMGQVCGTILWESKRTKAWSDGWLSKLRDDGRSAKADAVALMSVTMPKEICTFGHRDGVWVTNRDCLIGVASALRSALLQVADARGTVQGQQGKMDQVYRYLAGPQFRQRVEAIVESFTAMQQDLEAEKKALTKLWAKREMQLARAATNTAGMHGDVAGIIGHALPEIDAIDLPRAGLPDPSSSSLPPEAAHDAMIRG